MQVDVKCKASQFAYPPPTTNEGSTQASKLPTAVLSTTNRAKQKAKQKAGKTGTKTGSKPSSRESKKTPTKSGGAGSLLPHGIKLLRELSAYQDDVTTTPQYQQQGGANCSC